MTGNTKVWRAPLAGLASVAMIATMGVAASTANAATTYKVTFDHNGHGGTTSEQSFTPGQKIAFVSASAADWVFTGWYTEPDLGSGVKYNPKTPVLADTTLYAHWAKKDDVVKVTFDRPSLIKIADTNQDNDETAADKTITLAPGDKLAAWEKPADASATDGKLVEGFKNGDTDFDFTSAVDKDVKLTVDWTASQWVKFSVPQNFSISGTDDKSQTTEIKEGGTFTLPTVVDAANKFMTVWNYNAADPTAGTGRSTAWNNEENTVPTKDDGDPYKGLDLVINSTATPGDAAHRITYNVSGQDVSGAALPSFAQAYVADGDSAPLPDVETYDGTLVFDGWYNGTERYYDQEITADTTLTGTLSVGNIKVEVKFDPNYTGGKVTVNKLDKGTAITKPADPTHTGYVFQGWKLEGDSTGKVYKTDKDFDGLTADSLAGYDFIALWLTTAQDQLKDLLDLKLDAYEDNSAKTAYSTKVTNVRAATGYADAKSTSLESLSKQGAKTVAAYIKELSDLKAKLVTTNQTFTDVFDGSYGAGVATPHSDEIFFVAEKKISTGYADGTFKPTGSMFRQDYAAFLYRLAGSPEYTPAASDNIFTDVTPATPHYKEILWAAKQGIIKGFADGTFKGLNLVNRQDAAAFLYRAAGSPEFDASKAAKTFTDVNESTPHYKEVLWAANTVVSQDYDGNGTTDSATAIIQGFQAGTFDGYATLLRQDGAAFLARTYFYINK